MEYRIELSKRSVKDLQKVPLSERQRIIERIEDLSDHLKGDVKHLTNHFPAYRLRCGYWRVLFEIDHDRIMIYRVLHRRESYR